MKKFSSFLTVLLLALVSFTASAQSYPRGDVDQDGAVNISDVTCLIDNLLNGISEGDVDQDGAVNISDVTCLIDYLLKGSWPDDPVTPPDTHEWVDLGLPSGTLWATCNIGASAPEEYGDHFAWGETEPKDCYEWSTYKWSDGSDNGDNMTKYCTDSDDGTVDGKMELDPEDDAAYVNWGPSWRMPTVEQLQELEDYCTWIWTQRNWVSGRKATGPNGNTLFLPAAGYRLSSDGSPNYFSERGDYWSRTLHSFISSSAYCLSFVGNRNQGWYGYYGRSTGRTVRAVRVAPY